MQRLLAFVQRHEHRLLTLLFLTGLATDLVAFTVLDLTAVNVLFLGYLGAASATLLLAHALGSPASQPSRTRRAAALLLPLGAAFAIGGLLSGCLIFYTKSAVLSVSWPFLLLLLAIFLGNEFLRSYRSNLAFQTVLLFFALYAYLIFALPLYVHRLGPRTFVESTVLATCVFALFLIVLALISGARLRPYLRYIAGGAAGVIVAVVFLYFSGLVPPIPLALKESGIYHGITRTQTGYRVIYEDQDIRLPFLPHTVRHVPGTPLYAYSAVFAPTAFSMHIVHRWERYDETTERWITETMVAFALSGGRSGGYRGYSEKSDPRPGTWRVSFETPQGQVIGRLRFNVENVHTSLVLRMEDK